MLRFLRSGHAAELGVNAVFPWLVYTLTESQLGRVHALMASAVPPIIWTLIQLVRKRRIDAMSVIVLAGIALSLAAFFGGGGYRMLQLREQLVPGVIALVFLGSVLIGRPLVVVLLRAAAIRVSSDEADKLERRLHSERVVRMLTRMNFGIGIYLLFQVAISVLLVLLLPVKEFLIVNPIINYAMVGLFLAAIFYLKPKMLEVFKDADRASAGIADRA